MLGADEIILNMGPQHPSTHGVLRVKLRLDGEKVIGSECVIGYLHRGVEKIAEHRSYQQFAPYVDRMDYVAAVSNGLGYCEAVEKLLGAEAPPRARVIRTILTELQRIASHLLLAGHACARYRRADAAVLLPARARRDSENFREVLRRAADHARVPHRRPAIRSVRRASKKTWSVSATISTQRVDEYETLLTENRIWVGRTKGIGIIQREGCDRSSAFPGRCCARAA